MERDREVLQAAMAGYEVGEELGRGGWGIVFAAEQKRLQRQVAIKMLPRAFSADAEVRARFEDEAQFAARLSHPHVVPVFDFVDVGGVLAIVMERMEARTLADRFAQDGALQDTACAITIAVASALHAAHRQGRVHLDVKPENVLFDRGDVPKLSDFGVAKIIGIGAGHTRVGDVIGTPAYMSPEQATGATVGPATDVYAAAVLAYELLSGRLPFPAVDSAVAQLYQHVHDEPIPLGQANPQVGEPIARAVMRGLAKDPAKRYESAEALAIALGQAATELFGSGWLRDAGVELRLTGRLLDAFRNSPRAHVAQRLPTLTMRAVSGEHPRLGTVYETAAGAPPERPPIRPASSPTADVVAFAMFEPARPAPAPPAAALPETAAAAAGLPSPSSDATLAPRRGSETSVERPVAGRDPMLTLPPSGLAPSAPSQHVTEAPAVAATPGRGSAGDTGAQPYRPAPSAPERLFVPRSVAVAPSVAGAGRRRVLALAAGAVALVMTVGLVAVLAASRGSTGAGSVAEPTTALRSPATAVSTATTPAAATSVLDRLGQPISNAQLDAFERGCGSLGLAGGAAFCRCSRNAVGGVVSVADLEEATAFFDRRAGALPPTVRAVMDRCTANG